MEGFRAGFACASVRVYRIVPCTPSPCLFEFVGLSVLIDPVCFVKEEIGFVDFCECVYVCVCVCVCELTHIYAFCVLGYKLIWVCVSSLSACPCTVSQIPCAAWTQ